MTSQVYKSHPHDEGPSAVGYLALVLSWLIPGLGHLLLGERARGLLFALTVHALFGLGLLLGGIRAINPPDQPIWTYTQFLAGWPMLIANHVEKSWMVGPNGTDAGSRFSQLMAQYQSERPSYQDPKGREAYAKKWFAEYPILTYHPKIQDIGSVYCGIAGMLNLLVMFDVLLRITGTQREIAPAKRAAGEAPPPEHPAPLAEVPRS